MLKLNLYKHILKKIKYRANLSQELLTLQIYKFKILIQNLKLLTV